MLIFISTGEGLVFLPFIYHDGNPVNARKYTANLIPFIKIFSILYLHVLELQVVRSTNSIFFRYRSSPCYYVCTWHYTILQYT